MKVNGILSVSSFCDVCSAVSRLILAAMLACGYSGVRVASFFEKLGHFFAFVASRHYRGDHTLSALLLYLDFP